MSAYTTKVRIFIALIGVLLLLQLRSMFFECNVFNLEHTGFELFMMLGYLLLFIGFLVKKFKGYVIGAIFFGFTLAYHYVLSILDFAEYGLASLDVYTLLFLTFINLIFLLYVLSTRATFDEYEPHEGNFHKVMFILMIIAFIAECYVFYLEYAAQLGLCLA